MIGWTPASSRPFAKWAANLAFGFAIFSSSIGAPICGFL
jgi:hypothetical protein